MEFRLLEPDTLADFAYSTLHQQFVAREGEAPRPPEERQYKGTLGKSAPRWVAPAGCDLDVKDTLPHPETLCKDV